MLPSGRVTSAGVERRVRVVGDLEVHRQGAVIQDLGHSGSVPSRHVTSTNTPTTCAEIGPDCAVSSAAGVTQRSIGKSLRVNLSSIHVIAVLAELQVTEYPGTGSLGIPPGHRSRERDTRAAHGRVSRVGVRVGEHVVHRPPEARFRWSAWVKKAAAGPVDRSRSAAGSPAAKPSATWSNAARAWVTESLSGWPAPPALGHRCRPIHSRRAGSRRR